MTIFPLILGIVSGVCLGTGIIYLFTGLRRPGGDRLQILFALFALAYAGAIATGAIGYKATLLEHYMLFSRWGGIFTLLALALLMWFVAEYTQVRPKPFLLGVLAVIILLAVVAMFRTNFIHTEVFGVMQFDLFWGETISLLDANESVWELIFFLTQIAVIGFLIYACVRQFILRERQEAVMLGIGLSFLIFALIFDMLLIDSGTLNFIYLGDFGFLPLLIVMSVQLANQVIKTEEELAEYKNRLEDLVEERTRELTQANAQLAEQIQERERIEIAFRQSERTARVLLDAPPDSALLIDPQGGIIDINLVAAERLGVSLAHAKGVNLFDRLAAHVADVRREKIAELMASKRPVRWEDRRAGRWIDNSLYPILDDSGEITSIAVFGADIEERKQAEEQLQQRIADLDALNQIVDTIATTPELAPALQRSSEFVTEFFKARYTHIVFAPIEEGGVNILSGYDRQTGSIDPEPLNIQLRELPLAEMIFQKGEPMIFKDLDVLKSTPEVYEYLMANQIKTMMLIPLWVRGEVIGLITVSQDRSDLLFSDSDLSLAETIAGYIAGTIENTRLLEGVKQVAATQERDRLARDLHDAVTQTIYSASLIAEVLPAVWERNPEEGKRNLGKLRQLVRGALAEMRTLLFALRPAALEDASLDILLRQLADAFTGRTSIPVQMDIDVLDEPPQKVKVAIYRITQETLNNIAKHAEATQAGIVFQGGLESVKLKIWDNGLGIDTEQISSKGMGMGILRERAGSIGAQLEIDSQPGRGTEVTLNWRGDPSVTESAPYQ